jgi:uncharacterized membrane protein
VTGTGGDEAARPAPPEVMDGIQSLHDRIDELHRLITDRVAAEGALAGELLHQGADAYQRRVVPAWRRETKGELRWPVALGTAVGAALQVAVPGRLMLISPSWVLPAAQGALLLILVAANPQRISRQSRTMRSLGLVLAALLSLANLWSVARLAVDITQGGTGPQGTRLLVTGAAIWLTNVIVFALWYWEFDRGGPAARALNLGNRYPDFQFPQMVSPPSMISPDWEPIYFDYLFLAFTNASAFSPTDVMPMSRWAKAAMTVQAVISIVTVALVVSRAVNILPSA